MRANESIQNVLREAASPETDPNRLYELAKQSRRRGELARTLAANPNLPTNTLLWLAEEQWEAFLQNPVLPLLLLEDPGLALRLPENALRAILREHEPPPEFLRALLRHEDAEIRASARLHRAQPDAGKARSANAGELPTMEGLLGSGEGLREMFALGSAPDWLIAAGLEAQSRSVRELADKAARESGRETLLGKIELLKSAAASAKSKAAARMGPTPEKLAELAGGGPYARLLAAKHPRTPPAALARLVGAVGEVQSVRTAALRNPSLPLENLVQTALAGDAAARRIAVSSRQAPAALLAQMASDADPKIRRLVARHRSTPSAALARLATDPDFHVRMAAGANSQTDEATLRTLAKDGSNVREKVARNRSCPAELLQALATDEDWMVRMYAVRNPRMPGDRRANNVRFLRCGDKALTPEGRAELAQPPSPEEAARLARRGKVNYQTPPEVLAELASDEDQEVRVLVAGITKTPPKALRVLAGDVDLRVRAAVAHNTSTPADVLGSLGTDPDRSVRMAALSHPEVPREIVEALLPDCSPAEKARVIYNKGVALEIKDQVARADDSKEVRSALTSSNVPLLASTLEFLFEQGVIKSDSWSYDQRLPLHLVEKIAASLKSYSRPHLLSSNEYHCRHPQTYGKCEPFPPEFLLKLFDIPDDQFYIGEDRVIVGIADYFATTPAVLETCARRVLSRVYEYRRHGANWPTPLTAVARNPKCPPALLVELAGHASPRVRLAAVTNPSFPREALAARRLAAVQEGASSGALPVRACALSQPEAPRSRLRAAALNGRWVERFAVAGNEACPRDVLAFLCEDANVAVSDLARSKMRDRFPDAFLYGKPPHA